MKATLFSIEELADKGFKFSEPNGYVYIGNSKWPTYKFNMALIHMLGKTCEVVSIEDHKYRKEPTVHLRDDIGQERDVPLFLLKTKLKIPKRIELKLNRTSSPGSYFGMSFKFPCSWSELNREEAIKVARWILKVTK